MRLIGNGLLARSKYKHFFLTYDDMYFFYNNTVLENKTYQVASDREKTINNLTCNSWFSIHGGKNNLMFYKSSEYSIGRKLGMFCKTRKPFFFRSKKKKK